MGLEEALDQMPLARPRGRLGAGPTLTAGKADRPPSARREAAMGVTGLVSGMAVHFAGCCHPLPGDRIVGIVTTGRGVTIHKHDCHGLEAFAATPERFIDVDWEYDDGAKGGHVGRIELSAENNASALAGLTTAIARQDGAVNSLRILNRSGDWCEVLVDVEVRDTAHLAAAGGDPALLIRTHAARISYVHLKGFQHDPFAFTPLDRGDVPTAPILQAMKDIGFAGWVCTELDAWPDPAEGARLSMDYLNRAIAG
jgi:hypothetical protein